MKVYKPGSFWHNLTVAGTIGAVIGTSTPAFAGKNPRIKEKLKDGWEMVMNYLSGNANAIEIKQKKPECDYSSKKERIGWDRVTINLQDFKVWDEYGDVIPPEYKDQKVKEMFKPLIVPHGGKLTLNPSLSQGEIQKGVDWFLVDEVTGARYDVGYTVDTRTLKLKGDRLYRLEGIVTDGKGCDAASVIGYVYVDKDKVRIVYKPAARRRIVHPPRRIEPVEEEPEEYEEPELEGRVIEAYFSRTVANDPDADLDNGGKMLSEQELANLLIGAKVSEKNWRVVAEYDRTDGESERINTYGRKGSSDFKTNALTLEGLGVHEKYNIGGEIRLKIYNEKTEQVTEVVLSERDGNPVDAELGTTVEMNGIEFDIGPAIVTDDLRGSYFKLSPKLRLKQAKSKRHPTYLREGDDQEVLPYDPDQHEEAGWGYGLEAEARFDTDKFRLGVHGAIMRELTELRDDPKRYRYELPPISNICTTEYKAFVEGVLKLTQNIGLFGRGIYTHENTEYSLPGQGTTETSGDDLEAQVGMTFTFK